MKPWYKVILIVKSTEKILIHTTKQNLSKKYLKKIITTHLDAGGARLSRRGVLAKMKCQQSMSFFIHCNLINF